MKSFTVNKNDEGKRLDRFVTQSAPHLPKSLMYKDIRNKRIKVNGKKSDISYRLREGDVVDMFISDEMFLEKEYKYDFLRAGKDLNILYEDENIILLLKPAGLLCHPEKGEYVDTLITRVKRYLYEKNEYNPDEENSFSPALANRIDRNTGGIVISCKTAESLRIMNEKIKSGEVHKSYILVTVGKPKSDEGVLESFMLKDEKKNKVEVYNHPVPGGRTMKTGYKVLKYEKGLCLIEARLYTGRTHQIRAQFSSIGCPLLGDGKYGKRSDNKKRGGYKKQFLYSYKIEFDFSSDAGILNYLNGKTFESDDIWFVKEFPNF